MNGCDYLIITHNRKLRGRKRRRGRAMCLAAGTEMVPCEAGVAQLGKSCKVYQLKAVADDLVQRFCTVGGVKP